MNFRRWVVFTFLIHVLVVAVDKGGGLVLYLLVANQADQHGKSGIVASLPYILMAIANLGLATSLVYFLRKGRYSVQQVVETTLSVALAWGGTIALLALIVTLWVLPHIDPRWSFDPWLVVPWCASVPFLLLASYGNSVQLATDRVRDYGLVHLVTSLAFLPAFFGVFFWLGKDTTHGGVPMAVAWGRLLSTILVAALVLAMISRVARLRLGLHRDFLREGLRYGWKANITSTLTYLNHRVDLLLLFALYVPLYGNAAVVFGATDEVRDVLFDWAWSVCPLPVALREQLFLRPALLSRIGLAEVAFYSMAVTWAELVWHFPEAMRDLFFSKVAGSTHEKAREMTPVLSRLGLCVSLIAGVAILQLIDPVMNAITWLAGKQGDPWRVTWSEPVRKALLVLTPGTIAFTVSKVLQADLAARNKLHICVNAQAIVLVLMVALDCVLMPDYGARGAALASTVAYVSSTLYTLWAYSRGTDTPTWRCLIVHLSDFVLIKEILVAVVRKVRWRRP